MKFPVKTLHGVYEAFATADAPKLKTKQELVDAFCVDLEHLWPRVFKILHIDETSLSIPCTSEYWTYFLTQLRFRRSWGKRLSNPSTHDASDQISLGRVPSKESPRPILRVSSRIVADLFLRSRSRAEDFLYNWGISPGSVSSDKHRDFIKCPELSEWDSLWEGTEISRDENTGAPIGLQEFYQQLSTETRDLLPSDFLTKARLVWDTLHTHSEPQAHWSELDKEVKWHSVWHHFFADHHQSA